MDLKKALTLCAALLLVVGFSSDLIGVEKGGSPLPRHDVGQRGTKTISPTIPKECILHEANTTDRRDNLLSQRRT